MKVIDFLEERSYLVTSWNDEDNFFEYRLVFDNTVKASSSSRRIFLEKREFDAMGEPRWVSVPWNESDRVEAAFYGFAYNHFKQQLPSLPEKQSKGKKYGAGY